MNGPTGATADKGFTLVEVMVALTVLSLILLTTIISIRTLGNTQGAIDRLTQRVDEIRTISGFLRDTLETTIVGGTSGGLSLGGENSGSNTTYFEMTPTSIIWKSSVLFGEGYGGAHYLRVAREEDEMVLRWQPSSSRGQPGEWEDAPKRVMVHQLEDLGFAYRRSFDGEWLEAWDRRGLPESLRARVKVAGRYWPDLILEVPN